MVVKLDMIFFALSLLSLGALFHTSKTYPTWLAVAICLAGIGYLVDSVAYFVVPQYNGDTTLSQILMLPVLVGEVGLAFTLLLSFHAKAETLDEILALDEEPVGVVIEVMKAGGEALREHLT